MFDIFGLYLYVIITSEYTQIAPFTKSYPGNPLNNVLQATTPPIFFKKPYPPPHMWS